MLRQYFRKINEECSNYWLFRRVKMVAECPKDRRITRTSEFDTGDPQEENELIKNNGHRRIKWKARKSRGLVGFRLNFLHACI